VLFSFRYANYITEKLPDEAPDLFGLHRNAEIGYLSAFTTDIFGTILTLSAGLIGGGGGGDEEEGGGGGVMEVVDTLKERIPEVFELIGMNQRGQLLLETEGAPYVEYK
jgi:dynein heavy chain